MGISIIVKGADYSAKRVGNAFYPCYDALVGARFYGSTIPDLSACKKSKAIGALVAGAGLGAVPVSANSINLLKGQIMNTGLTVPATNTVMYVGSASGWDSQPTSFGGTETDAGGGVYAGNSALTVAISGVIQAFYSLGAAGSTSYQAITAAAGSDAEFVAFTTVDSSALKVGVELHARGVRVMQENVTITQAQTAKDLSLRSVNAAVGAVTRHRHVAVFNKVLTAAERLEVFDWVKTFYAARGVTV